MNKKLLIIFLGLFLFFTNAYSQLPPVAQALYDSAFANNPVRGQYSIDSGAVAMATADGNCFYLKWFPNGGTPASHPLLITIHGTAGTAFDEFSIWHDYAKAKGVGIIAFQWYKGYSNTPPNDYFDDIKLYEYIDTALTRIQYPSNRALFHGFSRGSAISYAVAFRDVQPPKGKNYFCTIMSNSGRPDSTYYLYNQINWGMYGHIFYNGKHWGMYCGGLDSGIETCCSAMYNSKLWVEANNGIVDLFIDDPNLGHGGFHQTPAYIDSCLNYYLPCYYTALVEEKTAIPNVHFFPNPFSESTTLQKDNLSTKTSLQVYNAFGQLVKEIIYSSGLSITFHRESLPNGLYLVRLMRNSTIILTEKLIIQD